MQLRTPLLSDADEALTRAALARISTFPRPVPGKMYLYLLHGRVRQDQQMDDWGFTGPFIGPLDAFHVTYNTRWTLFFESAAAAQAFGFDRPEECELSIADGLIEFQGVYYGDWEVQLYKAARPSRLPDAPRPCPACDKPLEDMGFAYIDINDAEELHGSRYACPDHAIVVVDREALWPTPVPCEICGKPIRKDDDGEWYHVLPGADGESDYRTNADHDAEGPMYCGECGERMRLTPEEVSHHIDESGEVLHDLDADHVAVYDPDYEPLL